MSASPARVVRSVDGDFDGKLNLEEAVWLAGETTQNETEIQEEFDRLDVNNDGFLSAEELDAFST